MSGKRRRRRLNKKEYERLERELAEEKEKARSESEDRQERIKVLWGLEKQERKLNEQKLKEQKLKKLLKCIRDLAENDELADQLEELVELAGLQDREIDYLTQFRRELERIRAYYPEELKNLSSASAFAEMKPVIEALSAKEKPKKAWERKRGGYRRWFGAGVGLIEYEFGGAAEAERRKPLSPPCGLPYEPTCLDEIFAGGAARMRSEDVALKVQPSGPLALFLPNTQHKVGLEELFGMERHRFGKGLPAIEKGSKRWYDYRAVVKIMHRLLSEEPREDNGPRRGKTRRLWPSNPSLRVRVLIGIHKRMESVAVSDDVWGAFTAVVSHHLVKGIEERLPEGFEDWMERLGRRYLD